MLDVTKIVFLDGAVLFTNQNDHRDRVTFDGMFLVMLVFSLEFRP